MKSRKDRAEYSRANTDAAPERLERVAHRCGVVDEHGRPCQTWTLREACLRHRRQRLEDGE